MPRIKQLTSVRLAQFIDALVDDVTQPPVRIEPGRWSQHSAFRLGGEPLVQDAREEELPDREMTKDEWLDWYENEFAGYAPDPESVSFHEGADPDSYVFDDAGESEMIEDVLSDDGWTYEERPGEPIRVSAWQLAADRATLAELQRDWRTLYRHSPDGSRSVRGEHPFSTEEGSAEWLQRARAEMRQLYREAKSDQERAAIKAREAALRARHNARCWARAFARYWKLDEGQTLSMVNAWQKANPIGWLGLEAAMKSLFEACWDHYYEARDSWNRLGEAYSQGFGTGLFGWSQAAKDEWLDSMPAPPEHPTHLVLSCWVDEHGRKHKSPRMTPVVREQFGDGGESAAVVARRVAEAERFEQEKSRVDREAHRVRVHVGAVRRWSRETETEWWAARKEWEMSGDAVDVHVSVPVPPSDLEAYYAERRRRSLHPEAWKLCAA